MGENQKRISWILFFWERVCISIYPSIHPKILHTPQLSYLTTPPQNPSYLTPPPPSQPTLSPPLHHSFPPSPHLPISPISLSTLSLISYTLSTTPTLYTPSHPLSAYTLSLSPPLPSPPPKKSPNHGQNLISPSKFCLKNIEKLIWPTELC